MHARTQTPTHTIFYKCVCINVILYIGYWNKNWKSQIYLISGALNTPVLHRSVICNSVTYGNQFFYPYIFVRVRVMKNALSINYYSTLYKLRISQIHEWDLLLASQWWTKMSCSLKSAIYLSIISYIKTSTLVHSLQYQLMSFTNLCEIAFRPSCGIWASMRQRSPGATWNPIYIDW